MRYQNILFLMCGFAWVLQAQTPAANQADLTKATFINSVGMRFVRMPAGAFQMGSTGGKGEPSERPQHSVEFAKPFFMGACEVTQTQWKAVIGSNPAKFPGDDHPVEFVSWVDAQAFVARLNERENGNDYRLPSEAEWEYACRAGSRSTYPHGEDEASLPMYAWFDANAGGAPQAVGKKQPNAWGLFDMEGNVWEWCQDTWHETYQGAPGNGSAWVAGGDTAQRVIRGGSWAFGAVELGSSARMPFRAESRVGDSLGLRVVVTPKN